MKVLNVSKPLSPNQKEKLLNKEFKSSFYFFNTSFITLESLIYFAFSDNPIQYTKFNMEKMPDKLLSGIDIVKNVTNKFNKDGEDTLQKLVTFLVLIRCFGLRGSPLKSMFKILSSDYKFVYSDNKTEYNILSSDPYFKEDNYIYLFHRNNIDKYISNSYGIISKFFKEFCNGNETGINSNFNDRLFFERFLCFIFFSCLCDSFNEELGFNSLKDYEYYFSDIEKIIDSTNLFIYKDFFYNIFKNIFNLTEQKKVRKALNELPSEDYKYFLSLDNVNKLYFLLSLKI